MSILKSATSSNSKVLGMFSANNFINHWFRSEYSLLNICYINWGIWNIRLRYWTCRDDGFTNCGLAPSICIDLFIHPWVRNVYLGRQPRGSVFHIIWYIDVRCIGVRHTAFFKFDNPSMFTFNRPNQWISAWCILWFTQLSKNYLLTGKGFPRREMSSRFWTVEKAVKI